MESGRLRGDGHVGEPPGVERRAVVREDHAEVEGRHRERLIKRV
jgi:hypothetical protein